MAKQILSGGREESFSFEVVKSNYHKPAPNELAMAIYSDSGERVVISHGSLLELAKILKQASKPCQCYGCDHGYECEWEK